MGEQEKEARGGDRCRQTDGLNVGPLFRWRRRIAWDASLLAAPQVARSFARIMISTRETPSGKDFLHKKQLWRLPYVTSAQKGGRGSRNAAKLRTNGIDFADRDGKG